MTSYCFGYVPGRCQAAARFAVVPGMASVIPPVLSPLGGPELRAYFTVAVAHFRAGDELSVSMRAPDGTQRKFRGRTRLRGDVTTSGYAGRGGALIPLTVSAFGRTGLYSVEVTGRRGGLAKAAFELKPPINPCLGSS